jgi:hypothetical protein
MRIVARVLLIAFVFAYMFAVATPVMAVGTQSTVIAGDCSGGNCPLPPDDGGCDGGSCPLPGGHHSGHGN